MSKSRGKTPKHAKPAGNGGNRELAPASGGGRSRQGRAASATSGSWLAGKRPILRFVLIFGLLMALFYGVCYRQVTTASFGGRLLESHLNAYASASGWVLKCLGHQITVHDQLISSPEFSVTIVRGCDGMEVTALFVSAVIALPACWWRKLVGVAGGVVLLAGINLVRIVTLFYVGIHFRDMFDIMHYGVWQALIVVFAILLWSVWAWWATRGMAVQPDVSS